MRFLISFILAMSISCIEQENTPIYNTNGVVIDILFYEESESNEVFSDQFFNQNSFLAVQLVDGLIEELDERILPAEISFKTDNNGNIYSSLFIYLSSDHHYTVKVEEKSETLFFKIIEGQLKDDGTVGRYEATAKVNINIGKERTVGIKKIIFLGIQHKK